jgi:hypothetical protein
MKWCETQKAFANAVRDPALAIPDTIRAGAGQPSTTRFNVYRNNSAVSLTDAVGDSYPVVRELVGDEFFSAMARSYVAVKAPRTPVLINYGDEFASFISGFEPAASLPFLGDVARLEWAWLQAYHAADEDSISADVLAAIAQDKLDAVRVRLHPSLQLVRSDFPVASIWSAHQIPDGEERQNTLRAIDGKQEYAMILRPAFDVNVHLITAPLWRLLHDLADGATLGAAAMKLNEDQHADLGGMLGFIFGNGAVISLATEE